MSIEHSWNVMMLIGSLSLLPIVIFEAITTVKYCMEKAKKEDALIEKQEALPKPTIDGILYDAFAGDPEKIHRSLSAYGLRLCGDKWESFFSEYEELADLYLDERSDRSYKKHLALKPSTQGAIYLCAAIRTGIVEGEENLATRAISEIAIDYMKDQERSKYEAAAFFGWCPNATMSMDGAEKMVDDFLDRNATDLEQPLEYISGLAVLYDNLVTSYRWRLVVEGSIKAKREWKEECKKYPFLKNPRRSIF